jgi:hypothetical protein
MNLLAAAAIPPPLKAHLNDSWLNHRWYLRMPHLAIPVLLIAHAEPIAERTERAHAMLSAARSQSHASNRLT